MRHLTLSLFLAAAALAAFSCFGLCTAAGQRQFDEMSGLIPLSAGVLAAVAAVAGVVCWLVGRKRD